MYCAADYTGTLSDGIQAEMEHYRNLGESRNITQAREQAYDNAWNKAVNGANELEKAFIRSEYFHDATLEQRRMLRRISDEELDRLYDKYNPIAEAAKAARDAANGVSYTETMTLDASAKIIKYNDAVDLQKEYTLNSLSRNAFEKIYNDKAWMKEIAKSITEVTGVDVSEEKAKELFRGRFADRYTSNPETVSKYSKVWVDFRREHNLKVPDSMKIWGSSVRVFTDEEQKVKNMDIGSLMALLGYDAINAENHGESGSYTVILNRTKLIIRRP
jgi:hypothetical protein